YVDTWLAAQGNWDRWRKENTSLASILDKTFSFDPHLAQLPGGNMAIACFQVVPGLPGFSTNAATFGRFLLNPGRGFPGKCIRCGRYFLNFGRYEKKYCAHRCAANHSAIKSTSEKRKQQRRKFLADARRALRWLQRQNVTPEDWKKRLAEKAEVTTNWVT